MPETAEPQEGSNLLSPPVTPERKRDNLKRDRSQIDEQNTNNPAQNGGKTKAKRQRRLSEEDMVMSIRETKRFSKTNIIKFIREYNHHSLKEKRVRRKPLSRRPCSAKMKEVLVKVNDKDVIDGGDERIRAKEATANVDILTIPDYYTQGYITRSKNRSRSRDKKESTKSSISSSPVKSSKNESQDTPPGTNIRDFNGKDDFLRLGNVQLIHDSSAQDIPDFEPSVELKDAEFLKVLKRFGTSINKIGETETKETIITNVLRLTPQQLFDTKRRFFAEKARKTYQKLTFKKTDAQKACKIDVNKASKLYEIYHCCGLLDDGLYFN